MKKLLIPIILAGLSLASIASAAAYDYHVSWQDGTNNSAIVDAAPSAFVTSFLGNDITNNVPAFYHVDGTQLVFDDGSHTLSVGSIQTSQVSGLDASLSTLTSNESTDSGNISSLNSSISSINASQSVDEGHISSLLSFKNQFASSTPINIYLNNATTTQFNHQVFTGTVSSGQVVFNLTKDGTTNGTAICTGTPIVTMSVDDPNNTYGLGKTLSNSNKNLTIAVNARSFTTTTILGISVLGGSTLTAASNGTAVTATVDCN